MVKGQHAGQTGLYGTESSVTNNALAGIPLNEGGDNEKQQPDFGANSINAEKIVMQPLKGYRSMVDSDVMKDMLKELTAKKVPVLFQTYYMVENGAATGYIGGLNTVSNIMSNTMETQEMQWKLLEYADQASGDRARLREAYTSKLVKNLSEEKSWPAAIYKTVGDGGKDKNGNGSNKDIPKNEDDQEIFSIGDLCKQGGGGGNGSCKLSQLLFPQNGAEPSPLDNNGGNGGGGQQYKNQGLQELSDEFVKLLGDIEFKEDGNEKYAQVLKQGFIPPVQKSVGSGGAQRRGFELEFRQSLGDVWEGFGKVLYGACTYMSGKTNASAEVAKGEFLATTKEIKFDDVVKASSVDAPLRANIIEQLVLISCPKSQGRIMEQGCCQKLQQELNASNLDKLLQGGQNAGSQDDLEDCSNGKLCRRMRIYLKTAIIIARSRAYQLYSKLYFEALKFATKPDLKLAVNDLYRKTFPYQTVQEMIEINRADWRQHLEDIAVQANSRAVGSGTSNAVGAIAGAAAMIGLQVDNAGTQKSN